MSAHKWPGLPTQITIKSGPDGHQTWASYPVVEGTVGVLPPNTTLVFNIRVADPDKHPVGQLPSHVRRTGLALVEVWEIDETAVPKGDPPDAAEYDIGRGREKAV